MTKSNQSNQTLVITNQTLKKLLLSSLVVFTFIVYTIRERLTGADTGSNSTPVTTSGASSSSTTSNTAARTSGTLYKDGQYTGDNADAYYGNVEVQATIQGGKITDVEFLDYPHDRRTSMFINSQAMPWLTSEAVQTQTARVNIISGATLTSQAFIQSLQSALDRAKNVS